MTKELQKLQSIHDEIARFSLDQSSSELKTLVEDAISIVENLTDDFNIQNFDIRKQDLVKDLKHTRSKEVKLYLNAKNKKDKQHHLDWCKYYLKRDLILYLHSTNWHISNSPPRA